MKIAVEGCCHGELDKIYQTVARLEVCNGFKIDLLIICGDFQSVRNVDDLQAMAVPPKYQSLNTFYKYYSGEKVAPVLTVFVGGNHEASNYLQELPFGGWVAPNIYYLGYAGIIQIGGVRIGGISGIYKGHDYNKGHFECAPYDESTKRSVYHVRNLEVFRLKQLSRHLDIFISHDWPTGIYNYGNAARLVRTKPFFKDEVENNSLGSKACQDLLTHLKPSYWFAAHLHVKFAAYVKHSRDGDKVESTKFLALDKCLPKRQFLQVLDIPHNAEEGLKIKLDPEWLRILQSTDHLMNITQRNRYMPGPGGSEKYEFSVTDIELSNIRELFGGDMTLPENFVRTAPPFTGNPGNIRGIRRNPLFVRVNPQTTLLCTMLEITDPNAKILGKTSEELLEESDIGLPTKYKDDDDDDDEHHEDEEDDNTMLDTTCNPSFMNSTLDVSQSSSFTSNISGSWDGLIKGGEPCQKPSSTTSPLPSSLTRSSTVPIVSSSSCSSNSNVTQSDNALPKSQRLSIADRLKSLKTKSDTQQVQSSLSTDSSVNPCDSQSTAILSRLDTQNCNIAESRSELLESSGVSSVSSSSSLIGSNSGVSPPVKRDSSDLDSTAGSQVSSSSSGGSGKKFKRRNASMYQETE